jgi:hypothetical protein
MTGRPPATPVRSSSAFWGTWSATPRAKGEIHIILDNLSAHKTKKVEQFLDEQGQRTATRCRGGVLESMPLQPPGRQRQHRVQAIQDLDGRLFIHAEDRRMLWRIQIQAEDVGCLAFKVRIVAGHVALQAVRLEPRRAPDAMDRVLAQAELARQFPARLVRGAIPGRALGGGRPHPRLELGRDDGRPALRVAIFHQPVEAFLQEALLPPGDGRRRGV